MLNKARLWVAAFLKALRVQAKREGKARDLLQDTVPEGGRTPTWALKGRLPVSQSAKLEQHQEGSFQKHRWRADPGPGVGAQMHDFVKAGTCSARVL